MAADSSLHARVLFGYVALISSAAPLLRGPEVLIIRFQKLLGPGPGDGSCGGSQSGTGGSTRGLYFHTCAGTRGGGEGDGDRARNLGYWW